MRAQSEFETALAEGLRCTQENVELRKRMAQEAQKRLHAQQDVRSKIMAGRWRDSRHQQCMITTDKSCACAVQTVCYRRAHGSRMHDIPAMFCILQRRLGFGELPSASCRRHGSAQLG